MNQDMEKLMLERLNALSDQIASIGGEISKVSTRSDSMMLSLDEIKRQTTKTNGRVTQLENFKIKIIAYATIIGIIASWLFHSVV
jgi:tetrahydromethanopterin S-methyltransferase subunit G